MSDTFNAVLPAEWAPQSGIQLTWPHAGTDWAHMLTEVQVCFARYRTRNNPTGIASDRNSRTGGGQKADFSYRQYAECPFHGV